MIEAVLRSAVCIISSCSNKSSMVRFSKQYVLAVQAATTTYGLVHLAVRVSSSCSKKAVWLGRNTFRMSEIATAHSVSNSNYIMD